MINEKLTDEYLKVLKNEKYIERDYEEFCSYKDWLVEVKNHDLRDLENTLRIEFAKKVRNLVYEVEPANRDKSIYADIARLLMTVESQIDYRYIAEELRKEVL